MNVSQLVSDISFKIPERPAVMAPKFFGAHQWTFSELEQRINLFCHRLKVLGITPGSKVLFFVKPNEDFAAITFALFRIGAVIIFIDPGMKKKYFFECLKEVEADAVIGIKRVHILLSAMKKKLPSIKIKINLTSSRFLGSMPLYRNLYANDQKVTFYEPKVDELAAILYTSGGTGKPKGVEYTHEIFINQTKMLQEEFNLTYKDSDIPCFPLFSFFTLSMGMTNYLPPIDVSKPSKANPRKLYMAIIKNEATFVAGSPAIWTKLADYCEKYHLTIPSVKYLVMFGAPIPKSIHDKFSKILLNGEVYTPYGATECLPVANISTSSLKVSDKGICVGKPLNGVEVKIIKNTNEVIDRIDEINNTQIGEILVTSKNVTKKYYKQEVETLNSKIIVENTTWHRMGDLGFFDEDGHLWFCGRKKHCFEYNGKYFYTIPQEMKFNKVKGVKKSALILTSLGPKLVIEKEENYDLDLIKNEIFNIEASIKDIIIEKELPVDTRHNIKIDRTALSKKYWS